MVMHTLAFVKRALCLRGLLGAEQAAGGSWGGCWGSGVPLWAVGDSGSSGRILGAVGKLWGQWGNSRSNGGILGAVGSSWGSGGTLGAVGNSWGSGRILGPGGTLEAVRVLWGNGGTLGQWENSGSSGGHWGLPYFSQSAC